LFEALEAMGVDPRVYEYVNLWADSGVAADAPFRAGHPVKILGVTIKLIMTRRLQGCVVVALGKRVSTELAKRGIVHVALVHRKTSSRPD